MKIENIYPNHASVSVRANDLRRVSIAEIVEEADGRTVGIVKGKFTIAYLVNTEKYEQLPDKFKKFLRG